MLKRYCCWRVVQDPFFDGDSSSGGSLASVPVVNLPVGFDKIGRPMGMQVIGRFGEDQSVLEFAMAYEAVTQFLGVRPNLVDQL